MTNLKTTTFLSNGRLYLQPAGPKTPIANDRPGGASQRGQGSGDFATPGKSYRPMQAQSQTSSCDRSSLQKVLLRPRPV